MISKRRMRRMRGKLRAAIREGLRSGPAEPFDFAEIIAAARQRKADAGAAIVTTKVARAARRKASRALRRI